MALQSNIQLFIGGNPINAFKEFTLDQKIGGHHYLEVVCRMDVLERVKGELAGESKNYLGEILTIKVSAIDSIASYSELEFKGVVTSVTNTKGFQHQHGDLVIIKVASCSVLSDDGPHYASHNDVNLKTILTKSFEGYDQSKLETSIVPNYSENLHYSVQSNESVFRYAQRLAAQYGEWFYYDGKRIVFGRPENTEELALTYGHDLQEFSVSLKPISNKYKFFTNDYLSDQQHEMSTEEVSGNATGYNEFVSVKGSEIFGKETQVFLNTFNDPQLKQRFDNHISTQKKAAEINQVMLSGMSDNPGVNLGKLIKIKEEDIDHGSYRITSVVHTGDENGMYQNRFQGITAGSDAYPLTNIVAFPKSDTQVAIVTDNADPEALGRVKVQLPWQVPIGEYSPWLRILTPHAGGDKGFHFIPEIDEEVLIGFEGGNAERPYVLGALYNGGAKPASWNTDKNDVKAIRTRSGHTIELNDTSGSEFITITDKNKNLVRIDTANNDITISAGENMTFNAKNMQINVEENMDISVGKNKTENITEDLTIMANNQDIQVGEDIKVISANYKQEAQEVSIDTSGEIKTNAGGKITIASAETVEYGE